MGPHGKKRKLAPPVEEITFDTDARQQFLTGFHKRKVARAKHAQEVAAKRAREERLQDRKMMREERKAEYQRAFEEHRKQMELLRKENEGSDESGSDSDDQNEEWEGIEEPPPVDYEAEYIDEDKYTTVTVEEMDPSREGLLKYGNDGDSDDDRSEQDEEGKDASNATATDAGQKAAATTKKKPKNTDKAKKKKKKFRYESKEDRKLNHAKQRFSKAKKAKARRDK